MAIFYQINVIPSLYFSVLFLFFLAQMEMGQEKLITIILQGLYE